MASIASRLVRSLSDIRLPFPMTQATAAPALTATADPAKGTVDISGIIYKLESLCESYDHLLREAAKQLESLEVPAAVEARLTDAAKDRARRAVNDMAQGGHLMNAEVFAHVKDYLDRYLDARCDLVDDIIRRYIESRAADAIRLEVRDYLHSKEQEHVSRISDQLEDKFKGINGQIAELWAGRMERLTSDRRTFKEALLGLMGDQMGAIARDILTEEHARSQSC
jgi:hypothetical protein